MTTDTIPAGSSLTIPLSLPAGATVWIDTQNSYIRTPNGSISYPLPLTAYGGDANENVYAWVNTAGIRLGSSRGAWGVGWEKVVTIRYTR